MNFKGHDNYQKLYVNGEVQSGGARTDKRLRMIDWKIFKDKRVLDIGCNSGMLSIHAKKMGATYVLGIDAKPVIATAKEMALQHKVDVDFRGMCMESGEFRELVKPTFDIVFFCAMYNHVKPENRTEMMQFIDSITNEVFIFETNFERKPDPYLDILRKYMTFDKESFLGKSGDRKPEDYNLFRFDRHKNEPYETNYLPVMEASINDIHFPTSFYNFVGDKQVKERAKVDRLKESIKINGQVRPVLVKKSNKQGYAWSLVEGGHRYISMKELNQPTIKIRDITGLNFKKRIDL